MTLHLLYRAVSLARWPFARLTAAAALAAVLTACGPGIGGTGTGSPEIDLAGFGARAASVCEAPFAAVLGCAATATPPSAVDSPSTSGAPNPPPVPAVPDPSGGGARRSVQADVATGRTTVFTIEGNQATLVARCAGISFAGTWGTDPAGVSRFFGSVTLANGSLQAAQLAVDASGGSGLALRLLGRDGAALLPLVATAPAAADPPAPERCP